MDVELVYEKFNNEGQSIDSPPNGVMTGSVRASVQQLTTNRDREGVVVSVEHTWPSDDKDYPGRTDTQGGEFTVYVPQRTFEVIGIKDTNRPWLIGNALIGKVNDGPFMGNPAREWMCMGASWTIEDAAVSNNRYQFVFEFQHNPDTWDATAVFIDARTGKPPPDLVEGEGIKRVEVHESENFEAVLKTRLQGA